MKSCPYVDHISELLSPYGNIRSKFMFGGYGIYLNDVIIGLIANNILYFKVNDSNKAQYQEYDSEPFTYEAKGKTAIMSYWRVPEEVLEDSELLEIWVQQSYDISKKTKRKTK